MRLDILRGWMQISIFVAHCVGSVMAWGIHAAWGISDSSEQFVLLSGMLLGSVFTLKQARGDGGAARRDILARTLRLWRTHLIVFLLMAGFLLLLERALGLPGLALRQGWGWLFETPHFALPAAAAMLYQPEKMGILPIFVACMAGLAPFLWLAARIGAWALLVPLALYAATNLGWIATPGIHSGIAFDPLAWQLIFFLGAWCGRRSLLTGRALPHRAIYLALAALIVLVGFYARIVDEEILTGPAIPGFDVQGKEILAPGRLLHALALAYLCATLLPRSAGWMENAAGRALAAIGRSSLTVFCLGLFLAQAVSALLERFPRQAPWLDPVLIVAGAAILALFARILDLRRTPLAHPVQAG
nr:OpgC domain-containing protein [Plastoroseomonas arctica]